MCANDWYCNQAFNKLNQSVGRIIRHPKDYGVVFLMDIRMSFFNNRKRLSKWIINRTEILEDGEEALPVIDDFFCGKSAHIREREFEIKNSQTNNLELVNNIYKTLAL